MILIDSRAGSADLIQFFPPGLAKIGHLEFGDAAFVGEGADAVPLMVGIERKTLTDLVGSLQSGRLAGHQLPGLLASYTKVYLIVEGMVQERSGEMVGFSGGKWRSLRISANGFYGYLLTLANLCNVDVFQTVNKEHTARLIGIMHSWWAKGWDHHKSHLGFAEVPGVNPLLEKPSLIRRVAKELPGIGWERSKAVEGKFHSLADMMNADRFQWELIPGIGRTLAKRITQAIRGESDANC